MQQDTHRKKDELFCCVAISGVLWLMAQLAVLRPPRLAGKLQQKLRLRIKTDQDDGIRSDVSQQGKCRIYL